MVLSLDLEYINQGCQRASSHCIWRSATNRMGYRLSKQSCPALDAKALLQFRTQNSSSRYISAPSPCMQIGIALRSSSLPKDCSRSWFWKPGKVFRWSQNFRIEALLWLPHISDLNCRVGRITQTACKTEIRMPSYANLCLFMFFLKPHPWPAGMHIMLQRLHVAATQTHRILQDRLDLEPGMVKMMSLASKEEKSKGGMAWAYLNWKKLWARNFKCQFDGVRFKFHAVSTPCKPTKISFTILSR